MTRRLLVLLAAMLLFANATAGPGPAPWQQSKVLKAAYDIRLSPEQREQFGATLGEFLQGFGSDMQRVINGRDRTDMARRIARKRRGRVKRMDKDMGKFITEEQWPAYENWRDLLLEQMDEEARQRRRQLRNPS